MGTSGRGHDVLGEGLGALQLRPPRADGPKHGDARGAHGVGDAGDERRLGADDDQARPPSSVASAATAAPSRASTGCSSATSRDAGVAGRAVQRGDVGVEGQRAAQGVFAGAAADDEDLHGSQRLAARELG